jgi:hypothetical protein
MTVMLTHEAANKLVQPLGRAAEEVGRLPLEVTVACLEATPSAVVLEATQADGWACRFRFEEEEGGGWHAWFGGDEWWGPMDDEYVVMLFANHMEMEEEV